MANVSNILSRDSVPSSKSSLRGYSHDTGMTFILERVHSISLFLPKRHSIPVQGIPECAHDGF